MITVFDPLFKPSSTKMSTDVFSTEIPKQVKAIVNSMGILEATEYGIGATDVTLDTIKAIDAALYNPKSKIIVPILFESPSGDPLTLGNAYTNANVAYLVINPKSSTPNTTSSSPPSYSVTTSGGFIIGTNTTDGEKSADQLNFAALAVPGGVTSASDSARVTESVKANGIQVAGLRLVNYRFYRSADDDYPITFDNVEQLFYGYKTTTSVEGESEVTTVDEVVITSNSFSLSLVQQILCIGCDNGQTFPILPTDDEYTVNAKKIMGIGSSRNFSPNSDVGYKVKVSGTVGDVGLAVAFLEGNFSESATTDVIRACHIYDKIYIATKETTTN